MKNMLWWPPTWSIYTLTVTIWENSWKYTFTNHTNTSRGSFPSSCHLYLSLSCLHISASRHLPAYHYRSALSTIHFSTLSASISMGISTLSSLPWHNSRPCSLHISRNYPPSDFLHNVYESGPEYSVYFQSSRGMNSKNEGFEWGGRAAGIWVSAKRDVQKNKSLG